MSLFLKSKFQEIALEKERLIIINKNLTEKVNIIENNDNNYIESKQLKVKTDDGYNNVVIENESQKKMKDNIINENKKLQQEQLISNKEEHNNEEDEAKNYLFDEDQIKEFTYILIKNFEAQKLDVNMLKAIFDEFDKESDEIILNDLALKISNTLNM